MSRRQSSCAVSLSKNLDELKRKNDLESVRESLVKEGCFPSTKDPQTAIITMEELKKLARAWKLHERRNFFKLHPTINELVSALLQHLEDNRKFKNLGDKRDTVNELSSPVPPGNSKPSNNYRGHKLKNMCGLKYFSRDVPPEELLTHSRYIDLLDADACVNNLVSYWRSLDFENADYSNRKSQPTLKSSAMAQATGNNNTVVPPESVARGAGTLNPKQQKIKHQNLAAHLAKYSSNRADVEKPGSFNLKTVQTFITVAETDDPKIASYSMIALSNISCRPEIRALLLEANAIHRFTSILPQIVGSNAARAASLLFYYFSCNVEIEDRVYNACSVMLQTNGSSDDIDTKLLALDTLNNLIPCIDRQRVVEIIVGVIQTCLSPAAAEERDHTITFLRIIQNICAFSNTHVILYNLDLLEILGQVTTSAVASDDGELGLAVARILHTLLNSCEANTQFVSLDFVALLVDLLGLSSHGVTRYVMRSFAYISSIPALVIAVCDSDAVSAITSVVDSEKKLANDIAKDCAKYLVNICQPISRDYLTRLVVDSVPVAVLQLIRLYSADIQCIAVRGMQNLLSHATNAQQLAEICFKSLFKMMQNTDGLGAIQCIYNISCVPDCEADILSNKIHLKILDNLCLAKSFEGKSAYLQVLVQLSSHSACVMELLQVGLISRLEQQLSGSANTSSLAYDISKLLLAVVSYKEDITDVEINGISKILQLICTKEADDQVVAQCSVILAFMSVHMRQFQDVDPVIRTIMRLADFDVVTESASTIIYNITCCQESIDMLLTDGLYINVMVRMLRSGKIDVQENIAQAMQTLCAQAHCIEMLMRSDVLSDLIVIALLRTSSIEIKDVCGDAFYNMLCHSQTRLKLIEGDLWWAISRVSRTGDSDRIRRMCSRALFDLSCDEKNISPLRNHHILSFIYDVTSLGTPQFLEICLNSILNIVNHCRNSTMADHEVVALIRIGTSVLTRLLTIESLQDSLALLLKCAQQHLPGSDVEFIHNELFSALDRSSAVWAQDELCRLYVSSLLWEVSEGSFFTKTALLQDLNSIWMTCYGTAPQCASSAAVCENIACTIMRYTTREATTADSVAILSMWPIVLADCVGSPRTGVKNAPHSIDVRATVLSILVYSLPAALSNKRSFVCSDVICGVLTEDLLAINNPAIRKNLLALIMELSLVPEWTDYLLDAKVCKFLDVYLTGATRHSEKSVEYCSTIILNMSLHRPLLPKLISEANNGLDKLIQRMIDKDANHSILMDISVVFYNAVNYCLKPDFVLSPVFVLSILSKIAERSQNNVEIIKTGKYVIGIILDKYSHGIGVNPEFVQSIFVELQSPNIAAIPAKLSKTVLRTIPGLESVPYHIEKKVAVEVVLRSCAPSTNQWVASISTEKKRLGNLLVSVCSQDAVVHRDIEQVELFPTPPFTKFIRQYDSVLLGAEVSDATTNEDTLVEEEEEEEEEEEPQGQGANGVNAHSSSNSPVGNDDEAADMTVRSERLTIAPVAPTSPMHSEHHSGRPGSRRLHTPSPSPMSGGSRQTGATKSNGGSDDEQELRGPKPTK